jgi:hypothetical protein
MIYKYFYDLDDINAFNFQDMVAPFLEICKETLWAMGESIWMVDDDP